MIHISNGCIKKKFSNVQDTEWLHGKKL